MGDIVALPGGLDRARVVALAHVGHRFVGRHAVKHRQAGERGASSSAAAAAGDLDPFCGSAAPGLVQSGMGVTSVRGQAKIWPADPPRVPRRELWLPTKEVETEVRHQAVRCRLAQAAAPN